jgi:hypothetical protein
MVAVLALLLLVAASLGASAHETAGAVGRATADTSLVAPIRAPELPVRPLFALVGIVSLGAGVMVLRRAPKLDC